MVTNTGDGDTTTSPINAYFTLPAGTEFVRAGDGSPWSCSSNTAAVQTPAGFTVTKSAPVPHLQAGQKSTYTITVKADGANVPAEVKDQLPDGLIYVSAAGDGWDCSVDDRNLVLCKKTKSGSASEEIAVTVETGDKLSGENVTNYASAGLEGRAPQPGPECTDANSCASSAGEVLPVAAYTIDKSAPVPPLEVNRQSTFTITVTADGENVATEVKEQPPQGTMFVSVTGEGWSCAVDASNVVLCLLNDEDQAVASSFVDRVHADFMDYVLSTSAALAEDQWRDAEPIPHEEKGCEAASDALPNAEYGKHNSCRRQLNY